MNVIDDQDLVVVGCGIAGLSAANRAVELGLDVTVLEKAPKENRGGHTWHSESFRVASTDCDLEQYGYEFAIDDYTPEDFYADIMKQTNGRADPDLARTIVDEIGGTVEWLTEHGVEWDMEPLNSGYTVARTFFDGDQLVSALVEAAESEGATFQYRTEAREIVFDDGEVAGVRARTDDGHVEFRSDAVVVAAGGYESSEEKRTRYYGSDYDAIKVRGSRYNTGEGIDMVLDAGGRATGQWGGAHMALIDSASPDYEGGANRVDGYQYGVLLNDRGERFFDEGEDARAHTYAKLGRIIFEEPNHVAYIVIDDSLTEHMRATGPGDWVTGDSVAAVLDELGCASPETGAETVAAFNEATDPDDFDPDSLDGNRTHGLDPEKTNWAIPLEEPPFHGYRVTGGITFGFGGAATDDRARALDTIGRPIPGLYVAGNTTGGLFYDNYPGGTGLANGAVFGRIAAEESAEFVGMVPAGVGNDA
ncbi:FAD-dependent tricarballylate dehydrogenase TcuA [Halorubrum vacuolatum]|uniref:Tricarballylate dehydrogenase n=1 Tax=Halorubrum vacuolatum TaxID=63740 RepID=A0A238WJE3_HALVU|nr:FAD-dependent tricarballylate dehydrogenase TcuA [Halorubrum vacuolatum]SNR46354.1 tricarballylate dehydrogenase [Halorubrum vacuolatum]